MKRLVFILLIVLAYSCEEPVDPAPSNLIEEEVFIETLKDIHILDAAFRQKVIKEDYPNQKLPAYYDQVFLKHNVTREAFDSSFTYYSHHPEKMAAINKEIENRITIEEDQIKVKKEDEIIN